MSIEACDFLRPSIKAKLQDCGILYTADLLQLFPCESPLLCHHSVSCSHDTDAHAHNISGSATDDAHNIVASARLAEHLPNMTHLELADLVQCTQAMRHARYIPVIRSEATQMLSCTATKTASTAAAPMLPSGTPTSCSAPVPHFAIKTLAQLRQQAALAQNANEKAVLCSSVATGSRALDALLGGGIPVGQVTELSGPPGVGKTQWLLQLAVHATLPVEMGGMAGSCLFVDTEGSFVPERLAQIACAAVARAHERDGRGSGALVRDTGTPRREDDDQVSTARLDCAYSDEDEKQGGRVDSSVHGAARCSWNELGCLSDENVSVDDDDDSSGRRTKVGALNAAVSSSTTTRSAAAVHGSTSHRVSANAAHTLTVEHICKHIHYLRLIDLTSFMAFLHTLPLALRRPDCTEHLEVGSIGGTIGSEDNSNDLYRNDDDRHDSNYSNAYVDLSDVRMIIIDSVAQPFSDFAALGTGVELGGPELTSSDGRSAVHSQSTLPHAWTSNHDLSERSHPKHPPVSLEKERKERVWRRSRLLFLCAQRLQQYASSYRLAVVVSNQMVSRTVWLPGLQEMSDPHPRSSYCNSGRSSNPSAVSNTRRRGDDHFSHAGTYRSRSEEMQKVQILVPALGDAWAHSLSTRVLLSFHHYIATDGSESHSCGVQRAENAATAPACDREDMVTTYRAHKRERDTVGASAGGGNMRDTDSGYTGVGMMDDVHQHRVARLIKSTTQPRAECCFAISRGGIGDVL